MSKHGYVDESMAEYLSDKGCKEPGLSTRVVCNLLEKTPLHAHWEHVRLGKHPSTMSPRGDLGSAIHASVLGGAEIEYVGEVTKRSGKEKGVPFVPTDWATQDAKDARDAIRAAGRIPMLEHQREAIRRATDSATALLSSLGVGRSEQSMYFTHEGVCCRGRADWIGDSRKVDVDLKTVDNADPALFLRRQLYPNGYDVQAGLRSIGHKALGQPRDIVFLLVEIEPPYAASFVGMGPMMIDLAEAKVTYAAKLWRKCLDAQTWPGYGNAIAWGEPPAFAVSDFTERTGINV